MSEDFVEALKKGIAESRRKREETHAAELLAVAQTDAAFERGRTWLKETVRPRAEQAATELAPHGVVLKVAEAKLEIGDETVPCLAIRFVIPGPRQKIDWPERGVFIERSGVVWSYTMGPQMTAGSAIKNTLLGAPHNLSQQKIDAWLNGLIKEFGAAIVEAG